MKLLWDTRPARRRQRLAIATPGHYFSRGKRLAGNGIIKFWTTVWNQAAPRARPDKIEKNSPGTRKQLGATTRISLLARERPDMLTFEILKGAFGQPSKDRCRLQE